MLTFFDENPVERSDRFKTDGALKRAGTLHTPHTLPCDVARSGGTSYLPPPRALHLPPPRALHLPPRALHLALAALVALLVGCGASPSAAPPDGGGDGGSCTGTAVCEGLLVKACRNNVVGDMVDDCSGAGACVDGRCLTPACAAAEGNKKSFAGCFFYTVQADNVASDAAAATSFLVTNPGT
jgi:hypothetical protein